MVRQCSKPGPERQGALRRSALTYLGGWAYHHRPRLLVVVPLPHGETPAPLQMLPSQESSHAQP